MFGLELPAFAVSLMARLKLVPKWVWYALAIGAVIISAVIWHRSAVKKHDNELRGQIVAEFKAQQDKLIRQAVVLKQRAEQLQAAANIKLGAEHAQAVADIHARADRLRSQTAYRNGTSRYDAPGVPGRPSGGNGAAGAFTAGADRDVVAVPRLPLIAAGESCDIDRAKVKLWQDWYIRQQAAYEDWLAATAEGFKASEARPPHH